MDRIQKLKEYMKTAETDSFLQHALALEYIKVGKDEEKALRVYKRGMEVAEKLDDPHAYREIQAAYEDAEEED